VRDIRNYVIAGLGLACAFLLGTVVSRPADQALAQQAGGTGSYRSSTVSSNGRYIAATGSVGSGMSVLWLVDTEARRLVVYGSSAMGKSVELRAARNIEWDLRLDEYNDDSQYKAEDLQRLSRRRKDGKPANGANAKDAKVPDVEPGKGDGK
jgi:hypothetical protein